MADTRDLVDDTSSVARGPDRCLPGAPSDEFCLCLCQPTGETLDVDAVHDGVILSSTFSTEGFRLAP